MRPDRMNGSATAPTDNAYATLARLKIALPLTQAALVHPKGRAESTVLSLIEVTRDLTNQLASTTISLLSQLTTERRIRLMRSLAQEVAYLIGRAHEREEPVDTASLLQHVKMALTTVDAVPGARSSAFFSDALEPQAQWRLALIRAAARMAESMSGAPPLARAHIHSFLDRLLARVENAAGDIETHTSEERHTVRVSLLTQFSKSQARLIAHRIAQDRAANKPSEPQALIHVIDVYHEVLDRALCALSADSPSHDSDTSAFRPEI
jgi:hypothetical protein